MTSPVRIHQLLGDVVEEVPASISEGSLQEGQGDQSHVVVTERLKGVFWFQPVIVTCKYKRKKTKNLKRSGLHDRNMSSRGHQTPSNFFFFFLNNQTCEKDVSHECEEILMPIKQLIC